VEINGKAVKNIETYMSVMGQQKPQVEIPIVVIREDKKVTVKVTPLPAR
jgi:S1-C subfamily serine protease